MSNRAQISIGISLAFALCTTPSAHAACGVSRTPSYSDIQAIRYVEVSDNPRYNHEVIFSELGLYYVGRSRIQMYGTYEAHVSNIFERTKRLLQSHNFFALTVSPHLFVTDTVHWGIAVQRCGVTTKLDWPLALQRPDLSSLFDGLDAIVARTAWHKTSDSLESPLAGLASIP
jgi:hypothetical protein